MSYWDTNRSRWWEALLILSQTVARNKCREAHNQPFPTVSCCKQNRKHSELEAAHPHTDLSSVTTASNILSLDNVPTSTTIKLWTKLGKKPPFTTQDNTHFCLFSQGDIRSSTKWFESSGLLGLNKSYHRCIPRCLGVSGHKKKLPLVTSLLCYLWTWCHCHKPDPQRAECCYFGHKTTEELQTIPGENNM